MVDSDVSKLLPGEKDQLIWDGLIDEKQSLTSSFDRYPGTQLGPRPCCRKSSQSLLNSDFICERCGYITVFHLTRTENPLQRRFPGKDFFGNTSCHYAAAALKDGDGFYIQKLTTMLAENFNAVNCFGETVLHMVKLPTNSGMAREQLQALFHQLSGLGFDFSKRDYHGRISIHALIESNLHCLSGEDVKLMLELSKIDSNSSDVFGHSLRQDLQDNGLMRDSELDKLLPSTKLVPLTPKPTLSEVEDFRLYKTWLNTVVSNNFTNRINNQGDTPLLSILKSFQPLKQENFLQQDIYKLLQNGAEIHMRDRQGNTALTIAASRGFHSCVQLLLYSGANIHARNFRGLGILRTVEEEMLKAKEERDTRLFSGILEGYKILVEKGAKREVEELDEWILSEKVNERTKKEEKELREFIKRQEKEKVFMVLQASGFL